MPDTSTAVAKANAALMIERGFGSLDLLRWKTLGFAVYLPELPLAIVATVLLFLLVAPRGGAEARHEPQW